MNTRFEFTSNVTRQSSDTFKHIYFALKKQTTQLAKFILKVD